MAVAKPRNVYNAFRPRATPGPPPEDEQLDLEATMLAVNRACRLRAVSADVTFTELSLQQQWRIQAPASILVRRVK